MVTKMDAFPLPILHSQSLDKIRDLLRIIADLRGIGDITTPDGLRRAIEFVLELADLIGLDEKLVERLRTILADQNVFQIVLSIVRFLAGFVDVVGEPADGRFHLSSVDGQTQSDMSIRGFLEWLPIVLQILDLLRRLSEAF
jgi:hypothetical protein